MMVLLQGCNEALKNWIDSKSIILIGIGCGMAGLQVIFPSLYFIYIYICFNLFIFLNHPLILSTILLTVHVNSEKNHSYQ